MSIRKKISLRIDPDLYQLLVNNAQNNLTNHVESLIVRGLVLGIDEAYNEALIKAERVYENALDAVKNKELEAKEEEYNLLLSSVDNIRSQLETQVNLMVNICISEGVPREKIERYAEDVDEENDLSTKIKFINRLTVELAKARGYGNETIKDWVRKK